MKSKNLKNKASKSSLRGKEMQGKEDGVSLDDAFAGDEDVSYGESKKRKTKGIPKEELEEELDDIERKFERLPYEGREDIQVKASKPISQIKKGDRIKIDGKEYEVDAHYVLIDHKTTREMTIEIFDSKSDKDYQLRYFGDRAESTLELYELQEIMYVKRPFKKIEW